MSALSPSHLSGGRFTYGNVYDSNYCSNLISLVVTYDNTYNSDDCSNLVNLSGERFACCITAIIFQ